MELSFWREALRAIVEGRKVIIKGEVLSAATPMVRAARELGATDVLVVYFNGRGMGPVPEEHEATTVSLALDIPDGTALPDVIRLGKAALEHPPGSLVARIEQFDPDHRAIAFSEFLNESPSIVGRPFLSHRRPAWLALDDKTVVDELWDAVGVARAASAVVTAKVAEVRAAWPRVARGAGVVLAVDATRGWTGGGSGTRLARRIDDVEQALADWQGDDRSVRVMPFLEGIPCSVHGIVFDEHVVALRPVEMVTLITERGGFFYAGCSSFYDPPDSQRDVMRRAARMVGAHLRDIVGFRGAFTIDGVMTDEGFLPTELNPRSGGGLATMARGTELGFPLQMLLDVIVAEPAVRRDASFDWHPQVLETLLLDAFDRDRSGGTWHSLAPVLASEELRLRYHAGTVADADTRDGVDITGAIGPSGSGSFLRTAFLPHATPVGASVGERARAVWAYADTKYGLGLETMTAARPAS